MIGRYVVPCYVTGRDGQRWWAHAVTTRRFWRFQSAIAYATGRQKDSPLWWPVVKLSAMPRRRPPESIDTKGLRVAIPHIEVVS